MESAVGKTTANRKKVMAGATVLGLLLAALAALFVIPASALTPPFLDAKVSNSCNGCTSVTATLPATTGPDLIVVLAAYGNCPTPKVPTDTAGQSFALRFDHKACGNLEISEYYASAAAALAPDTFTCASTTNSWIACVVEAWGNAKGFDIAAPFVSDNGCGAPCVTGVTTPSPNDAVFDFGTDTGATAQTAGAGYTLVAAVTYGQDGYSQYKIAASPLSAETESFGIAIPNVSMVIADAVAPSGTTTTTTSSTTTSTTTSTSTSTTSTSAAFKQGKWNYIINNGGSNINNFTMTVKLTSPLVGKSCCVGSPPVPVGNWSLILNAYAPTTYRAIFTQFYIQQNLQHFTISQEVYASNSAQLFSAYKEMYDLSSTSATTTPTLSPPSVLAISLTTNKTGFVIAVGFTLTHFNGFSETLSMDTVNPYSTPILAVNPVIVGMGAPQTATFTSASATVTYSSSGPITWSSSVPAYVWGGGTINEDSNERYFVPVQVDAKTIQQAWMV